MRLKVGVDVPWVTSWTAEGFCGVRPCATTGGRLAVAQVEKPGQGRPQYSRNHLVRQRRSVAGMLCPMCGGPTAEDDRWTLTARRTSAAEMRRRGLSALLPHDLEDAAVLIDAGGVAPLHRACAARSLRACPHLQRIGPLEMRPFPAAWLVAPLTVAASSKAAPLPGLAQAPPRPVVSFLQLFGVTGELAAAAAALSPQPS